MADRLLPIAGTVLGTIAGTAVGMPQLGAVAGGALGGLGGGAIKGNPLQGLASGAIGGAGSAFGSQFLGPLLGKGLGNVLPELPVADVVGASGLEGTTGGFLASPLDPVASSQGLDLLGGGVTDPTGFLSSPLGGEALLNPAQSTGFFGLSSQNIGNRVGGLIGSGVAGTVANQLIQGGGPQPPGPPRLPASLGPLPGAPPDLRSLVVRTGGGLPQTLEELLRRR